MSGRNTLKILVVDDNPADRYIVKVKLKEANVRCTLIEADSLNSGIETANQHEDLSIVLLDLTLPDCSGLKTLTGFLTAHPQVAIIVITGLDDDNVGEQAVKIGAQDYLVKNSFNAALLKRIITYSIQRHKTQQKLISTANELSSSEQRYKMAQEMAHFGDWELDLVKNEMEWTDEVYRIFGFEPKAIMPTLADYINFVFPEDRPKVRDFIDLVTRDGKLHEIDHRIIVQGKSIKHVAVQAKVAFNSQTSQIMLTGAIQDVTERKKAQELLEEKAMSERSSKFKEEILEDMGFHIRTPLSSITNLSFLLSSAKSPSEIKDFLKDLNTSIEDLSLSVNNLLNFSFLVSEKIVIEEEEMNLEDFLKGTQQNIRTKLLAKNISFKINFGKDVPPVIKADSNKMKQVFLNILDNSIKFTDEGGKIEVNVTMVKAGADESLIRFSITDNGCGMDALKIQKLLKADELVNPGGDDQKGIGIAIVNKLVKHMNGEVKIESYPGGGSTFHVICPVKMIAKRAQTSQDEPDAPLRILMVEDHFLNQIATKKILTTWSDYISVDIAENGVVALGKLQEYEYDIILMDLQMPEMNGIEATEKIRETSEIPIIALTANASKKEMQKCFDIGFNDYLSKPFKPHDLYQKIMSLLTVSH